MGIQPPTGPAGTKSNNGQTQVLEYNVLVYAHMSISDHIARQVHNVHMSTGLPGSVNRK